LELSVISEVVANDIMFSTLSGFHIKDVEIGTKLMQYYQDSFPEWKWMRITGIPIMDDFGIDSERRLIVSQAALNLLRKHGLNHADIFDAKAAPSLEERSQNILESMRKNGPRSKG
jgi:hypothetical protein